ncbi:tetratricopeptide repeat protein, partial [uncultured Mucilaginibacter sp.]|uniref:tetratricopeptide repeat protein n=1 Tax=uncultured Mucilaginibacter sp. TaxID=797541 RepID=UPI0025D24947
AGSQRRTPAPKLKPVVEKAAGPEPAETTPAPTRPTGKAAATRIREHRVIRGGNDIGHSILAEILQEKGDYIGAEAEYREAVRLDPDSEIYRIQLTEIAEIICSQGAGSQRE